MKKKYIIPSMILTVFEQDNLLQTVSMNGPFGNGGSTDNGDGKIVDEADSKGGNDGFLFGDDEDEIGGSNKPWWRR